MKSLNTGGDRIHLAISCHQTKLLILHLIDLWAKGQHGNLQTIQAVAKTIDFSPQTDSKALLLN